MSEDEDGMARVFPLRGRKSDEQAEPVEVVEGEVVDDAEYRAVVSQREQARIRREYYVNAVRTAATHRHTRSVIRHVMYVTGGAAIVGKRMWDSRSNARYERMMRSAELRGDHAAAMDWEQRGAAARAARHARRMDLLELPVKLTRSLVVGSFAALGLLLAAGATMAVASGHASDVGAPLKAVISLIGWVVLIVSVVWGPILLAAPWVVIMALWAVGRAHSNPPAWVMPEGQRSDDGAMITPSIVVTALRDLGISELRKAIRAMEDGGAGMLGPIKIAGCGVEVDITLPSGVSTDEVQNKRRKFAENLGRHEHEAFLSVPQAARTVRAWIADSGALDEPIGPSPLVIDADATADYYTGRAPWGQDLRGDAALLSLHQRHVLATGLSNQGKTASLRALALWASLDPSVEFRIGDLKGVGDWRMFDGLATVLIQGPTDEHVAAVTEMVEAGVAEMKRRLMALEQSGATDGVTRDMARAPGSGFHPLLLIVDEAQVAFMCPLKGADGRPYGGQKATSRYFMGCREIHNQGRAVNVVLWQGTQDPTDQNLPKLVREGAHIRASLVLGTESQARMALGDKAVDGGAAPHKLRVGLDKGTLVVAGDGVKLEPGQSSITIRTHFISGEDAIAVAGRAKRLRKGVTTRTALAAIEAARDLLDDLDDVLDDEPVRIADVPPLLRGLAPGWGPYKTLKGTELRRILTDEYGIKVPTTDNIYPLDPAAVRRAIVERDSTEDDDALDDE